MVKKHIPSKLQAKIEPLQRCIICHKIIAKDDLIFIQDKKTKKLAVHLKCYVEIQDKICAECGLPFADKEEVFYCEEHHQYFHATKNCLDIHLKKHMHFLRGIYDQSQNRVILEEHSQPY
ncbi:MAG: hypothetical protein ACTSXO_01760 [Candidatus Heimdallarchaeota archaeon]|nr:MAG: hypothetical protein DRO63_07815 [Candidatus Gerdarchaeota archaeon]RLI69686.1 MAG: hypothetical protein DRP02_10000 [Candidatus Gerdarchaeota archaeon]